MGGQGARVSGELCHTREQGKQRAANWQSARALAAAKLLPRPDAGSWLLQLQLMQQGRSTLDTPAMRAKAAAPSAPGSFAGLLALRSCHELQALGSFLPLGPCTRANVKSESDGSFDAARTRAPRLTCQTGSAILSVSL